MVFLPGIFYGGWLRGTIGLRLFVPGGVVLLRVLVLTNLNGKECVVDIKNSKQNQNAVLALKGRFDFYAHRDFTGAYTPLLEDKGITTIAIDMKDVLYMDSSSMGMLLLLKDRAEPTRKKITLVCGQNAVVRELLAAVSFHKLFEIS